MTVTTKGENIGNFYINVEINAHGVYKVGVYEYGKTIRENYYSDEKKANASFARYRRLARKNQI